MAGGRVLAFGELMLRLSPPGREVLLQSGRLDVWLAGAEANVATGLARLGHDVAFASRVPDDDLGRAAIAILRGHGVDTRHVEHGDGRMALYFVTAGAGARASDVIYDRAGSSFALADPASWDWSRLLDGIGRLHLSGITPALGPAPAQAAIAAARAAAERAIPLSFDGNYRAKLWARWDGQPRATLREIVRHADLLFGDHRDIALLLDRDFAGEGEERGHAAASAAFEAFPGLRMIASTARRIEHVERHHLSARVEAREGCAQTEEVVIAGIVDRIGGGDAFAAGVLGALLDGGDRADAARNGLALAVLKHSLPGDASLFRQADIDAYLAGGLDVRR